MKNEQYVVACINGFPPSEAINDYASWFALKSNQKLKILHALDHQSSTEVSDLSGSIGFDTKDELLEKLVEVEHEENKILQKKAKIILERSRRRALRNKIEEPKICLRNGRLIENLLDINKEVGTIVIGKYGQNHHDTQEDSVGHKVEAVIRSIEKPILVVSKSFKEPSKIVLAYDGSPSSEKALHYLINSPVFTDAEINVIYLGEKSTEASQFIDSAVSRLQKLNFNVKGECLSGEADEAMVNYIKKNEINLTIMGAFGHHWLRNLLVGSFTSKMLTINEIPLLLIR